MIKPILDNEFMPAILEIRRFNEAVAKQEKKQQADEKMKHERKMLEIKTQSELNIKQIEFEAKEREAKRQFEIDKEKLYETEIHNMLMVK